MDGGLNDIPCLNRCCLHPQNFSLSSAIVSHQLCIHRVHLIAMRVLERHKSGDVQILAALRVSS